MTPLALITMLTVQVSITFVTAFFLARVLKNRKENHNQSSNLKEK